MPQQYPTMPDMRTAATAAHELYQSYIAAGFSRKQAFELTQIVLAESLAAQYNNQ